MTVEATPADGPDPYGEPDPSWLGVDWQRHLRWVEVDGARVVGHARQALDDPALPVDIELRPGRARSGGRGLV